MSLMTSLHHDTLLLRRPHLYSRLLAFAVIHHFTSTNVSLLLHVIQYFRWSPPLCMYVCVYVDVCLCMYVSVGYLQPPSLLFLCFAGLWMCRIQISLPKFVCPSMVPTRCLSVCLFILMLNVINGDVK